MRQRQTISSGTLVSKTRGRYIARRRSAQPGNDPLLPFVAMALCPQGVGYDARFGLELTAVAPSRPGAGSPRHQDRPQGEARFAYDDYFSALFYRLSAGQSIEFRYSNFPESRRPAAFQAKIIGSTLGHSPDEAEDRARTLFHDLQVALTTVADSYGFAPICDPEKLEDAEYAVRAMVRARGVEIGRSEEIGFLRRSDVGSPHGILAAPAQKYPRRLDTVVSAMRACPTLREVCIRVTPKQLADHDRTHLIQLILSTFY